MTFFEKGVLAGLLFMCSTAANAQNVMQPYQEYDKRVRSSQQVEPLSSDLFGEQVSLYDRSTAFEHVDISLEGNSGLAVELRRRLDVRPLPRIGPRPQPYSGAANWDIAVPYITGTFDSAYGWNTTTLGATPRCSTYFYPHTTPPNRIEDIWSGYTVSLPGAGQRDLMGHMDTAHRPPDDATRLWTTRELDAFSCVPMAAGYPGEGFLMTTRDGVTYRFDVGTTRSAGTMAPEFPGGVARPRVQVFLLASRVEDRFGNWVEYIYNASGHPTMIRSNDGRRLDLTYANGNLVSAAAHGRKWDYSYESGQLSGVQLPDGKNWTFAYSNDMTLAYPRWDEGAGINCAVTAPLVDATFGIEMAHPGGATGEFVFVHERHYRSGVPAVNCVIEANPWDPTGPPNTYLAVPNYFDKFSLSSKTISGAGIPGRLTWLYTGHLPYIPLWSGNVPPCLSCAQHRTTSIINPDGSALSETYGIVFGLNEGKLLGSRVYSPDGGVLREETLSYMTAAEAAGQPFPDRYGSLFGGNDVSRALIRPLRQRSVVQQGVSFSSHASAFDVFARPLSVTRSSTLPGSPSRTEVTAYHDNLSKWVLGQPARLTINGVVASETSYDANAQPTVSKAFGRTVQTLGYNADGTVATVRDGNGHTTTLSNWKRGVPQSIRYPATPDSPTGAVQSAVVNDHGWITRITDENGYATDYQYDPMGRLSRIAYPSDDSTAWNATTLGLARSTASAYGIPAGHWQHTVATGNGRKVSYLDALFRPLLVREYDSGNANGTQRFVRQTFDHAGRPVFASYPSASATPTSGTWTEYDALGRPTSVSQDSELGLLTTTTAYLAGFQTRTTSPMGHHTTTSYMAWDEPTTDYPVAIAHPGGVFTDIARDAFGKPTALTRRDAGTTTLTRRYVYNAHHQLCKTIEPETGATIMAYDAAGNLAWSRTGATQTGTAGCNTADIPVAQRTVRSYDARQRIQSLVFPDNLGNTQYGYTPDGLLASVTADNGGADIVSTVYTYNRRRLLTGEALGVGSHQWGIGYGYDANGHLATLVLPGGETVAHAPNALGQPTRAGTHATGAMYFPNGGLRQFSYGHGIVRTLVQNARGLPDRSRDAYGSTAFHDDSLDYDQHGNVAAISDGLSGGRGNRTMSYDALDRLTQTVSPMFGTATYGYDVLDNLRRVRLTSGPKVRDHTYVYDGSHRLSLVTNTSGGATVSTLGYDVQGNLSSRDGQAYRFDFGNRLRSVDGVESYLYDGHGRRVKASRPGGGAIYSMYGQDGVLRYQRNERTGKATEYVHLGGSLVAELEAAIALATPTLTVPGYSATGSYTVSWTASAAATKYQLQERQGSGAWSTVHDAAGTSRAVSGKAAGSWGYRVRACSAATCGDWSPVSAVTVQLAPTAAPALSVPATGPNGAYTVSWGSVASATRYQLQERQGSGAWSTVHDAAGTSRAVSGKVAGSWSYQVRACNAAGCSGWSSIGTVVVLHPPGGAPTLTVPATNLTGSYSVSWTTVATTTRYELQERLGSGAWSTIHDASATSRAVSGKTAGTWAYQVRACNAAGCGGWSATGSTAVTLPPANSPSLTVPEWSLTGSYSVSWTTVATATRYELQERLGSGSWSTIQSTSATSRALSGKTTGSWSYRVRGCNVAGCGGYASAKAVSVTRPPAVPWITRSVKNQHYIGQLVHIQCWVEWTPVPAADRYELQVPGGARQYAGPETGVSGSYNTASYCAPSHVVRACNAAGCSAWSSPPHLQTLVEFGTPPGNPGNPGNPVVPRTVPQDAGLEGEGP